MSVVIESDTQLIEWESELRTGLCAVLLITTCNVTVSNMNQPLHFPWDNINGVISIGLYVRMTAGLLLSNNPDLHLG